jgi:hypothetical protein
LQGGSVNNVSKEAQCENIGEDVVIPKTYVQAVQGSGRIKGLETVKNGCDSLESNEGYASCLRRELQVDSVKVHRCFGGIRVHKVEDKGGFRGFHWRNRRYSRNFRSVFNRYAGGCSRVNSNNVQTKGKCGSLALECAEVEEVPVKMSTEVVRSGSVIMHGIQLHAEHADADVEHGIVHAAEERVVDGDRVIHKVEVHAENGDHGDLGVVHADVQRSEDVVGIGVADGLTDSDYDYE